MVILDWGWEPPSRDTEIYILVAGVVVAMDVAMSDVVSDIPSRFGGSGWN